MHFSLFEFSRIFSPHTFFNIQRLSNYLPKISSKDMASLLARRCASASSGILFSVNSPLLCKSHYVSSSNLSQLLYFSSETLNKSSSKIVPEFFVEKYNFSPAIASKVATVSASIKNPQNCHVLLSFLKDKGFSNTQLEKIVKYNPRLVTFSIEQKIKPRLKVFEEFGFSADEVVELITKNASILHREASSIKHSLSLFKRLLGSNASLVKCLKKSGSRYAFSDPEMTLVPNIEFLKSSGVSMEQINHLMYKFPYFFAVNPESMRKYVGKVDELGVERNSKTFIYAVWVVSRMSDATFELKLKTFRELGFSEDELLRVCRSYPVVLHVSGQKINKVKEFLVETGKYDISCIVRCPDSLNRSVEKRYKPRVHVLKVLEKRNLIKKWPSLSTLCKTPNNTFFKKFVAPYIDEFHQDLIVKTAFGAKVDMNALS